MDRETLIAFEHEIADLIRQAKIRAPVHLCSGNEDILINIFKHVKPTDWVVSTHRSHLHALLKGIPPEWLKREILAGHSITLNNREHRFFTSAIVGGGLPIAVGLALAGETVWCFFGDMAARTGAFHECVAYAAGHRLPVHFVIEDNGLSVCTPTQEVWGNDHAAKIISYRYKSSWPHQGDGGPRVIF